MPFDKLIKKKRS